MIEKDKVKKAEELAKKTAGNLFGNRTKEQEEALKNVKTVGSPENLVRPSNEDEDTE